MTLIRMNYLHEHFVSPDDLLIEKFEVDIFENWNFPSSRCDNGQCIRTHAVCNGKNDCIDESDEKRCGPGTF